MRNKVGDYRLGMHWFVFVEFLLCFYGKFNKINENLGILSCKIDKFVFFEEPINF